MKETSTNKAVTNNDAVGATTSVMPDRDRQRKTIKTMAVMAVLALVLGALIAPIARVNAMPNANADIRVLGVIGPNDNAHANASLGWDNRSNRTDITDEKTSERSSANAADNRSEQAREAQVRDNRNVNAEKPENASDEAGTVLWVGNGLDSIIECRADQNPYIHWVLTPGGTTSFSEANLLVDDQDYGSFYRKGNADKGAMHLYTDWFEVEEVGEILAEVDGTNGNARVVISDACRGEATVPEVDEGDVLGDDDKKDAGGKGGGVPGEEAEEGETLSAAATADLPSNLPQTGASNILAFLVSIFSGIATGAYTWMRGRKQAVQTAMARVKNDS